MNNCRLCGRHLVDENFKDVFLETLAEQNLYEVIGELTPVQINSNDKFSKKICEKCFTHLRGWLLFLQECKKTQESLALMTETLSAQRQPRTSQFTPRIKMDNENVQHFECDLCPKSFDDRRRWYKHKVWHRDLGQFQCEKCAKIFQSKHSLETHLYTHSDKREYCCHVCGALFRTAPGLLNHVSIHRDRTFTCPVAECEKRFRHRSTLEQHMKSHSGERPFACPHCPLAFPIAGKLERHIQGVHNKTKKFTCSTCDKQFLYANNYKAHLLRHEGTKNAKCDECGKCFVTNNQLLRHRRSHTKEKPFKCEICGKTFADCSNRKRHVLQHADDDKKKEKRRKREEARLKKQEENQRKARERQEKVEAEKRRQEERAAKKRLEEEKRIEQEQLLVLREQNGNLNADEVASKTYADLKNFLESTEIVETLGNTNVDDVATLLYSDITDLDLEKLNPNQVIQVVFDPIFQVTG